MTPSITTIDASQVQLMLFARKIAKRQADGCRWAVMGEHVEVTRSCRTRYQAAPSVLRHRSLLTPMNRGCLDNAIERMRLTQGLPAIRRTFGCGLKAVLAETKRYTLRATTGSAS